MTKSNMDRIVIVACTLLIFTAGSGSEPTLKKIVSSIEDMEKDVEQSVKDGVKAAAASVSSLISSVEAKTEEVHNKLNGIYFDITHSTNRLNATLYETIAIVRDGERTLRTFFEKQISDMMSDSIEQLLHSAGDISEKCTEIPKRLHKDLEEAWSQSNKCIDTIINADITEVAELAEDLEDLINDVTSNKDLVMTCNSNLKDNDAYHKALGCVEDIGEAAISVGISAGTIILDGENLLQQVLRLPSKERSCFKHHTYVPMETSIKQTKMELLECISPSVVHFGQNLLNSIKNETIDIYHQLETTYHATSEKVRHINETLYKTIASLRSKERSARLLIQSEIQEKLSHSLGKLQNYSGNDLRCTNMPKQLDRDLENALYVANVCIDTKINIDVKKLGKLTEGVRNLNNIVVNNKALVDACIANSTVSNAFTKAKQCLHDVSTLT